MTLIFEDGLRRLFTQASLLEREVTSFTRMILL